MRFQSHRSVLVVANVHRQDQMRMLNREKADLEAQRYSDQMKFMNEKTQMMNTHQMETMTLQNTRDQLQR